MAAEIGMCKPSGTADMEQQQQQYASDGWALWMSGRVVYSVHSYIQWVVVVELKMLKQGQEACLSWMHMCTDSKLVVGAACHLFDLAAGGVAGPPDRLAVVLLCYNYSNLRVVVHTVVVVVVVVGQLRIHHCFLACFASVSGVHFVSHIDSCMNYSC